MFSRVYVEITNNCNMKCSFCHGHSRKARSMTSDEFLLVLDKLVGVTEYIYYHLMGEPLLHPQLCEIIRMSGERDFKSVITTNGTLLDKRGEELISSGVYKVNISVHSLENGDETLFIEYMNNIAEFAEKASSAGIIVVLRLWNNGCDNGQNEKVIQFLHEKLSGEWAENTKGIRIHKKLHVEWGERFVWPDMEAPLQGDEFFCYGLRDHFGILCDGTVVPCCMDSDGIIALGNIFDDELSEILSSERAESIRCGFEQHRAVEELCCRCSYAQRFIK